VIDGVAERLVLAGSLTLGLDGLGDLACVQPVAISTTVTGAVMRSKNLIRSTMPGDDCSVMHRPVDKRMPGVPHGGRCWHSGHSTSGRWTR
jgi:hypothetical protein